MHKVIVERPRLTEGGPYRRPAYEKHGKLADMPMKEGMRKRHRLTRESKCLNENLAPLKRYLRSQVGRPWNTVYRDISTQLRPSSAVKQHVRDHLWDLVERHATLGPKGVVYRGPERPWWKQRLWEGELYIHPRTGILSVVKRRRY